MQGINSKLIETVKDKLINAYNPREIYLFGSSAWGTPGDENDLDLLIKDEFKELSSDISTLCFKIKNEGIKLYEAA